MGAPCSLVWSQYGVLGVYTSNHPLHMAPEVSYLHPPVTSVQLHRVVQLNPSEKSGQKDHFHKMNIV